MATCDALTGLANRTMFKKRLEAELQPGLAHGPHCLLYVDLDRFTEINDTFGHAVGDAVLVEVTRRIAAELGPDEFAGRTGGDDFAILLHVEDAHEAQFRASRLAESLAEPVIAQGRVIGGGASIGFALHPDHARDCDGLLRAADMALFEAKSAGRRSSVLYDADLEHRLSERRSLEADLRRALTNGELEVHYQPFQDIATRRTAGYEALVRWRHPTRGLVLPSLFVPIAEETSRSASGCCARRSPRRRAGPRT
jgi:diguanylate cyclase (GGDEF)-like protein